MKYSGIYIVRLTNEKLMPVTRAKKYVGTCAVVNRDNIKIGKSLDLSGRRLEYFKEFDEQNVIFEPLVELDDTKTAERVVLRALKQYRKLSPKGGKLEWLEGIAYIDVKRIASEALDDHGIEYALVTNKVRFII